MLVFNLSVNCVGFFFLSPIVQALDAGRTIPASMAFEFLCARVGESIGLGLSMNDFMLLFAAVADLIRGGHMGAFRKLQVYFNKQKKTFAVVFLRA